MHRSIKADSLCPHECAGHQGLDAGRMKPAVPDGFLEGGLRWLMVQRHGGDLLPS